MAAQMYTTKEAATELGITPGRVRQMVLNGSLPAQKFGRDLMIKADDLEKARTRQTEPGRPPNPPKPTGKKKPAKKR